MEKKVIINQKFTRSQVELILDLVMDIVREKVDPSFETPKLECTLRGRTAGNAQGLSFKININLIHKDYDNMVDTVKHEVAHLIEWKFSRKLSHSPRWKRYMRMIGGDPSRCHDMEIPPARKTRRAEFMCSNCGKKFEVSIMKSERLVRLKEFFGCPCCKKMGVLNKVREYHKGDDVIYKVIDAVIPERFYV